MTLQFYAYSSIQVDVLDVAPTSVFSLPRSMHLIANLQCLATC